MNEENKESLWILRNRDSDFVRAWQRLFLIADNIEDWTHENDRENLQLLIKEIENTDLLFVKHPKLRQLSDAFIVRPVGNIINVHDSRLSPARQESELFLSNQVKVEGLIPKEAFTDMVDAIKALPNAQPETCNYLDFLLNKHKENDFNLNVVKVLYQAWHLTQNEDIEYDTDLLLDVLQERATVYKGTAHGFFPDEDFSCHEGTAEQLLDSVTPTRVALTPDDEVTAQELSRKLYTEYYSQFYSLISNSQGEYIIERNLTLNERAQDVLYRCAVETLPEGTIEIEPIVDDLSEKVLERFYNKFNPIAESILFDLAFITKEKTGRERLLEITKEFLLMNDYKLEDGQKQYIGEDEIASRQTAAINALKIKKVVNALKNIIDTWMDSYEEAVSNLFDYQENADMSKVLELLKGFGIPHDQAETLYNKGLFNPKLTANEQERIEQMSKFVPLDIQAEAANLNGAFKKIADSVMRCFLSGDSLCLPATNHEAGFANLNRNLLTTDELLRALDDGNTLVYKAITNHPDFSINTLIDRGANGMIPLVVAAEKGYLDFIKAVFAHPDFSVSMLSTQDRHGQNALLSAARGDHTKILKTILDLPDLPENIVATKDDRKNNILSLALVMKNIEMAKIILAQPNLPQQILLDQNGYGANALTLAIEKGYVDIINTILAYPDLPSKIFTNSDLNGNNPLIHIAKYGNVETFSAILAQPNCPISILASQNIDKENVLMLAAKYGYIDLIDTILAQPNLPSNIFTDSDCFDYNALMHAARSGHAEAFKRILVHPNCPKNTLEQSQNGNYNVLMAAAMGGNIDIINTILTQPNLSSRIFTDRTGDGYNALMYAAQERNIEAFIRILEQPDCPTSTLTDQIESGENALFFAVKKQCPDIVTKILAQPNLPSSIFTASSKHHTNVLMLAIRLGDSNIISALLKYPSFPASAFINGNYLHSSALTMVVDNNNMGAVKAILSYPNLPDRVFTDKVWRGGNALALAIENNHIAMIKAILAYPTLPNNALTDTDNGGHDILSLALKNTSDNAQELVEAIVNKKQKSTGLTFTDRFLLLRYGYMGLSASGIFSLNTSLLRISSSSSDQLNNANQTMEGNPPQAPDPDPAANNRQEPGM